MGKEHSQLVMKAKNAIRTLYHDTSVSKQITLANLEEIEEFIGDLITELSDNLGDEADVIDDANGANE